VIDFVIFVQVGDEFVPVEAYLVKPLLKIGRRQAKMGEQVGLEFHRVRDGLFQ